jgi:hypothetical protein
MKEAYQACLNAAVANNNVRKVRSSLEYSCGGATARSFFQLMGDHERFAHQVQTSRRGTYRIRYFDDARQNQCWQKVENADGSPTNGFGCQLYQAAPAINE